MVRGTPILILIFTSLLASAQGQAGDGVIAQMYHPAGPLPSYEVATIKKEDPGAPGAVVLLGGARLHSVKSYILNAYGASTVSQSQVVGGPAWVATDGYVIDAKAPEELRLAMLKMTNDERNAQTRMMQQSLLAERFHLKVHFETREMPVYELELAKGGLKVKEVPPPPPFVPGQAIPSGAPKGMRPGMLSMRQSGPNGEIKIYRAMALDMRGLIGVLRNSTEVSGKPIVDKTGFKGNFDLPEFKWASMGETSDVDAPSLFTALEDQIGLKLKTARGMVEVLVIDSIERPSEN